jgi:hypothetical protein
VSGQGQPPGHIVFNHSSDKLVIGILKDHPDTFPNQALLDVVTGVHTLHEYLTLIRQEQRVTMTGQRRFATPIMA